MISKKYTLHAIQLKSLDIQELHFSVVENTSKGREIEESMFQFITKHSAYDSDSESIGVKLEVRLGYEDAPSAELEPLPFKLKVAVAGLFKVDQKRFNLEYIEDWASKNAPLILYPYVRENVNSLATRCGFYGLLLPLFEVPTIKNVEPQVD